MTIVAAVKSRDCLVVGTDSMTTVVGPGANGTTQVLKGYSNATKLFQLGMFPVAVATWGVGNVGSLSVGGLVSDFQNQTTSMTTIQSIAQQLAAFVQASYATAFPATAVPATPVPSVPPSPQPIPANLPILGFFVGGYSANAPLPELWEVRFSGPTIILSEDRMTLEQIGEELRYRSHACTLG